LRGCISKKVLALLLLPLFLFLAVAASAGEGQTQAAGLFRVERDEVCVVADRAPGEPTLEVKLGGKTYHVCCTRCEARLKDDPSFRFAIDPVTGRAVDKADAFIAVTEDGRAFYFESEKTALIFDAFLRAQSMGEKVY